MLWLLKKEIKKDREEEIIKKEISEGSMKENELITKVARWKLEKKTENEEDGKTNTMKSDSFIIGKSQCLETRYSFYRSFFSNKVVISRT